MRRGRTGFYDRVQGRQHRAGALQVPANRRFRLQLRNNGDPPAEFESDELRKEKVLAPNTTSVLVFRTLDPGEYPFFDDSHPDARRAILIAK
jgi:Cupredoxin-like domain